MTNTRRKVMIRYHTELDATIKEILISEDDTPKSVLLKLKAQPNFFIADEGRHPFGNEDSMFGYCTFVANPPVQLLHQSALISRKARVQTPKKDHRFAIELRCGDEKTVSARGILLTYAKALAMVHRKSMPATETFRRQDLPRINRNWRMGHCTSTEPNDDESANGIS
jgi:hypothetical protein